MLDLSKHTVKQLRSMVKSMGVTGYSKLRKAELVKLAYAALEQQRREAEKVTKELNWVAKITGKGRAGLKRNIIVVNLSSYTGQGHKEVKVELPCAQDGEIYEWRQKSFGHNDQGGFMYHKNGKLVPVTREFVELLV